jgi:hypothetical protein
MRVNRAVEKLRIFFTRRGIVCSAAALTAAISANAVHAAPIGLAVSISTAAALSGTAIAATATTTATKAIALITAKKTLIAGIAAVALAAGVGMYVIQQVTAAPPVQSQPVLRAASPPIALARRFFHGHSIRQEHVEFIEHAAHGQLRSRHSSSTSLLDFHRFRRFPKSLDSHGQGRNPALVACSHQQLRASGQRFVSPAG